MLKYEARALKPGEHLEYYRLRYEIYCKECKFEPPNPAEIEMDWYDTNGGAFPYGLFFQDEMVGCFRLVTGEMPIQKLSRLKPLEYSGEISRFCIIPEHRKPEIIKELSKLCVVAGLDAGLEYGYALMQPGLARMTKSLGFPWEKVLGYDGIRNVYRIAVRDAAIKLILSTS